MTDPVIWHLHPTDLRHLMPPLPNSLAGSVVAGWAVAGWAVAGWVVAGWVVAVAGPSAGAENGDDDRADPAVAHAVRSAAPTGRPDHSMTVTR